jgi:hypothetical protein
MATSGRNWSQAGGEAALAAAAEKADHDRTVRGIGDKGLQPRRGTRGRTAPIVAIGRGC